MNVRKVVLTPGDAEQIVSVATENVSGTWESDILFTFITLFQLTHFLLALTYRMYILTRFKIIWSKMSQPIFSTV